MVFCASPGLFTNGFNTCSCVASRQKRRSMKALVRDDRRSPSSGHRGRQVRSGVVHAGSKRMPQRRIPTNRFADCSAQRTECGGDEAFPFARRRRGVGHQRLAAGRRGAPQRVDERVDETLGRLLVGVAGGDQLTGRQRNIRAHVVRLAKERPVDKACAQPRSPRHVVACALILLNPLSTPRPTLCAEAEVLFPSLASCEWSVTGLNCAYGRQDPSEAGCACGQAWAA